MRKIYIRSILLLLPILICISALIFFIVNSLLDTDPIGPGACDYSYNLSGEYSLSSVGNDNNITILYQEYKEAVPSKINEIAWNSQYILAKQVDSVNTHYYIIDVRNKNVIGPLSKADFDNNRNELKINKKLILKNPDKYKYLQKKK